MTEKEKFQEWALRTQTDFNLYQGDLYWFKFKFWELDRACTNWLIREYKNRTV